jgi:hypothetical protein
VQVRHPFSLLKPDPIIVPFTDPDMDRVSRSQIGRYVAGFLSSNMCFVSAEVSRSHIGKYVHIVCIAYTKWFMDIIQVSFCVK